MKKEYTILFYALSRFGNLHYLGRIFDKDADKAIKEGKEKFSIHLRETDNLRVFVCNDAGDTLADFTFERGQK